MSNRYLLNDKVNHYFIKDKKAEIFDRLIVRDSMGGRITYYIPLSAAPLWCYAKQISASLYFAARAYQMEEKRLFVFNFNPDIAVYKLIRYRGQWYEITRVDTDEDYNGDMFVYVKDATPPQDNYIMPYGYTA